MFVFALFNLQGTVLALPALAVSFYMLPQAKPFVKNFFQVFSNFFLFCGLRCAFAQALGYITTPTPFCQYLFSLFSEKDDIFRESPIPGNSRGFFQCFSFGNRQCTLRNSGACVRLRGYCVIYTRVFPLNSSRNASAASCVCSVRIKYSVLSR